MNTAKIIVNNETLRGTLDFYVMLKIHEDLKEHGIKCAIQEIFKYISDLERIGTDEGQLVLCSIIIHSLSRSSDNTEDEIADLFNSVELEDLDDIFKSFTDKFEYVNKLLEKCMPKTESSEYEDDDIYISKKDEWNFPHMEYLWYTLLKRTDDFYRTTPKSFFAQMDVYKEIYSKDK